MFCPKCGSILMPKSDRGKKVIACSCGYKSSDLEALKIKEEVKKEREIDVIDEDQTEVNPKTEAECPKCGNGEAYFFTQQTRAADEPPTRFYKCTKCKHVWREYS